MQFHQVLRQCESDAKPTLRPLHGTLNLSKHLEDAVNLTRVDAAAAVSYFNQDVAAQVFDFRCEPDVATFVRELARVVQEIDHDLTETYGIGIQVYRIGRQGNG